MPTMVSASAVTYVLAGDDGACEYTFEGSTAGSTRDVRDEVEEVIKVVGAELSCGIEYNVADEDKAWAVRETEFVGGSHSEVLSEAVNMRLGDCGTCRPLHRLELAEESTGEASWGMLVSLSLAS